MKVRAQFDNTDNALFPNQFVNARLLVKTLENVVTVPTSAIQRGAPGTYVYVINADSTVSVRQIKTGVVDGNLTAVKSGLTRRRPRRHRWHRPAARRSARVRCTRDRPSGRRRARAQAASRPASEDHNSGNAQTKPADGGQ